jgi:hypothetical protein
MRDGRTFVVSDNDGGLVGRDMVLSLGRYWKLFLQDRWSWRRVGTQNPPPRRSDHRNVPRLCSSNL